MAAGIKPFESDPALLSEIRRYGKFDPTGCYQCGSCTLSCDLADGLGTFPRKNLRQALLGARGPLLESLEPWICHDCGDCSLACPRQAEPRISMQTLRRFLSAQYDWTGISSKVLQSDAWYLGSFIFVALLVLGLIIVYHLWYVGMAAKDFATTPFGLDHMFPLITYYTMTVILFPLLLLFSRVLRIWRLTVAGEGEPRPPLSAYVLEAWTYIYQSATHSLMKKCPEKGRWLGHWLLAFSVVLMLTIKVFALRWFQTDNIYPFYNPQRWVGYIAAGLILYSIGQILIRRLRAQGEIYKETSFRDLVFPVLLVLTVLTGLAAHIFRYAGFALTCHYLYAAHVVIATPMLLVEMSFGKWSHMIYRPLALYFLAVKKRAGALVPAGEAVPSAL